MFRRLWRFIKRLCALQNRENQERKIEKVVRYLYDNGYIPCEIFLVWKDERFDKAWDSCVFTDADSAWDFYEGLVRKCEQNRQENPESVGKLLYKVHEGIAFVVREVEKRPATFPRTVISSVTMETKNI